MRYRALSAAGDYTFGQGSANFLIAIPEAVAQAVQTRLLLERGEWFLDRDEGTPYKTDILGAHTQAKYDAAIRARIAATPGVAKIISYASTVAARKLVVTAKIDTAFGIANVNAALPL